jgi:hypothetical protein
MSFHVPDRLVYNVPMLQLSERLPTTVVLSAGGGASDLPPAATPVPSSAISSGSAGAGTPWYAQGRTLAMRLGRMS